MMTGPSMVSFGVGGGVDGSLRRPGRLLGDREDEEKRKSAQPKRRMPGS